MLDAGEPEQPGLARPARRPGCFGSKGWLACGVLFFGGLVVLTIAALSFAPRLGEPPPSGAQPGGVITGRVLPAEAAREVGSVRLMHGEGFGSRDLFAVELADDGSFRCDAPPLDGYYVLMAGAGTWSLEREVVSMLTEDGAPRAADPVELVLQPACLLEVHVRRRMSDAPLEGELRYRMSHSGSGLFGLFPSTRSGSLSLHDGAARLESMPPGEGELTVTMEDGESRSRSFELTLEEPHVTIGFDF